MTEKRKGDTRAQLLEAAADLISASPGQDVPLRAICDRVGVRLPTLYHFFGSKEGLLDAVVEHGFDTYLGRKSSAETRGDAISDLRAGWDAHVRFGLDHPGFYALMYGQVVPHQRPAAAKRPFDLLLAVCERAAREHRLAVTAEQAAAEVLAANVGTTLFLITAESSEPGLSERVREAVIASITSTSDDAGETCENLSRRLLRQLPPDGGGLGDEEQALLRKWLATLADRP